MRLYGARRNTPRRAWPLRLLNELRWLLLIATLVAVAGFGLPTLLGAQIIAITVLLALLLDVALATGILPQSMAGAPVARNALLLRAVIVIYLCAAAFIDTRFYFAAPLLVVVIALYVAHKLAAPVARQRYQQRMEAEKSAAEQLE